MFLETNDIKYLKTAYTETNQVSGIDSDGASVIYDKILHEQIKQKLRTYAGIQEDVFEQPETKPKTESDLSNEDIASDLTRAYNSAYNSAAEGELWKEAKDEIEGLLETKLYYGHLFCHVLHQNYIVKKGVNAKKLKKKLLKTFDKRGAEYPAEHNVGHEYFAKQSLSSFYKKLDPTNGFNPGIGQTSKLKYWK